MNTKPHFLSYCQLHFGNVDLYNTFCHSVIYFVDFYKQPYLLFQCWSRSQWYQFKTYHMPFVYGCNKVTSAKFRDINAISITIRYLLYALDSSSKNGFDIISRLVLNLSQCLSLMNSSIISIIFFFNRKLRYWSS